MRSLQSVTPPSSEAGYPRWGRLVGYARPATMQSRTQLVGESHVAVACQTRIRAGLESEPLRSCRTRGVKPSRYVMSEVEAQVDTFARYLGYEQKEPLKPGLDLGIASSQCRDGETMSPRPPYPHPALTSTLRHQPSPQHHLDRCSVHLHCTSTQTANPAVARKQPSTAAIPRLLRSPREGDAARANHSSGTNMSRASVVTTMPHPRQSEAMIKARRAARNIATTRP
jgi:hypothetical protein